MNLKFNMKDLKEIIIDKYYLNKFLHVPAVKDLKEKLPVKTKHTKFLHGWVVHPLGD